MELDEFEAGAAAAAPPPENLSPLLRALWLERAGKWEEAHRLAQEVSSPAGAWVHAYLHRREGDTANAAYWYRRAGRQPWRRSLEEEWRQLVSTLLPEKEDPG